MRVFAAVVSLSLLAGCATTAGTDRLAERDPLEGLNRGIWSFNQATDKVLLKPVTSVYRAVTPRPARRGISNIFSNLSEPFSVINNLLQGKPKRAVNSLGRFLVNTTLGIGGLADHASKMGMKQTREDFGQTLAAWGVNGGPYLVLPLFGPSTLRDGVGMGVSQVADPYRVALRETSSTVQLGATAAEIINIRNDLIETGVDDFLKSSADPYTAARSAYLQRRRAQILDQEDAAGAAGPAGENAALDAALKDIDAEAGGAAPADAPQQTPAAPGLPDTPAVEAANPAAAPSPVLPTEPAPQP